MGCTASTGASPTAAGAAGAVTVAPKSAPPRVTCASHAPVAHEVFGSSMTAQSCTSCASRSRSGLVGTSVGACTCRSGHSSEGAFSSAGGSVRGVRTPGWLSSHALAATPGSDARHTPGSGHRRTPTWISATVWAMPADGDAPPRFVTQASGGHAPSSVAKFELDQQMRSMRFRGSASITSDVTDDDDVSASGGSWCARRGDTPEPKRSCSLYDSSDDDDDGSPFSPRSADAEHDAYDGRGFATDSDSDFAPDSNFGSDSDSDSDHGADEVYGAHATPSVGVATACHVQAPGSDSDADAGRAPDTRSRGAHSQESRAMSARSARGTVLQARRGNRLPPLLRSIKSNASVRSAHAATGGRGSPRSPTPLEEAAAYGVAGDDASITAAGDTYRAFALNIDSADPFTDAALDIRRGAPTTGSGRHLDGNNDSVLYGTRVNPQRASFWQELGGLNPSRSSMSSYGHSSSCDDGAGAGARYTVGRPRDVRLHRGHRESSSSFFTPLSAPTMVERFRLSDSGAESRSPRFGSTASTVSDNGAGSAAVPQLCGTTVDGWTAGLGALGSDNPRAADTRSNRRAPDLGVHF